MIPREWADVAEAPRGHLLIERRELPTMSGLIKLPSEYRRRTLSSTAKIIARGEGVPERFAPGTFVMLTAGAGKPVYFGRTGDSRILARITPASVLMILHLDLDSRSAPRQPDSLPLPTDPYPEQFPEGSGRGLR